MKKFVGVILLVALCCASVFAADVAASVKFHYSYGSDGFSASANAGLWEPMIALSTNGDEAGALLNFYFPNFNSVKFSSQLWAKPNDQLKITFNLDVLESSSASLKAYYDAGKFYLGAGFGVHTNTDWNNGTLYAASFINLALGESETSFIHLDGLANFDVAEKKPSFNYAKGELTYSSTKYGKNSLDSDFDLDTTRYFEQKGDWAYYDNAALTATGYKAGVRFDSSLDSMFTAYGLVNILTGAATSRYELEVDAGLEGADVNFSTVSRGESVTFIASAMTEFAWTDGFEFSVSKGRSWLSFPLEAGRSGNFLFNYTPSSGAFLTSTLSGSIGACSYELFASAGFDAAKAFKWSVGVNPTVNF